MDPLMILLRPTAASEQAQSDVLPAVISAIGALVVAIASAVYSAVTGRRQVLLQKRLDDESKAKDARRDYEYDARKRLYRECEPVLFQARELASEARGRIVGLAIAARNDDISEDGTGWLAGPGYYTLSTCYSLLAPLSVYLILQRRLTDFDLGLEPRLHTQYEVLKLLYASVSDDFGLADATGLQYRPDDADPGMPDREKLLAQRPAIYRRQGLFRGTMSVIGDAFLVKETETTRCKTFSEFYLEREQKYSPVRRVLPELLELVQGFHPARCPVFWLVLVEQLMLYDVLLQCGTSTGEAPGLQPPRVGDYVVDMRWFAVQGPEEAERERQHLANLTCVRDRVTNRIEAMQSALTGLRRSRVGAQ